MITFRHTRSKLFLAAPLALALTVSACGSDSKTDASDEPVEELTGSIFITGSSTVEPISVAVGEAFGAKFSLVPDVEGPGTGDGFKKFCAGEADIANASRPIKDEEKAACESDNVEFQELKIGLDALTVMTSQANDKVDCLTKEDLYGLVGPESEDVKSWSDASEHGATSKLPDAPLEISAPGTESGTYDAFWELAIKSIAEEKLGKDAAKEQPLRPDYGGLADDNEIVDAIASSESGFGWVGFAFAEQADGIKEIEIDGGDGCVAPSADTVGDGTYPLSRALYIYVNTAKLKESPALQKFVDFYLSDEGIAAVTDSGYIALDDAELTATRDAWKAVQ